MADGSIHYGSVCSGIEAASVAWHGLGWSPVWLAEIEPFPSAVLAHHYPDVPNLGDMTKIASAVLSGSVGAPDVLVGGTPCQAFSVAGLRQSLSDERGNLSLRYVELADAIDHVRGRRGVPPAIVVWENVPGVLNTKDNAFGCFLAGLAGEDEPLVPPRKKWANAGCVYGPQRTVAWRTLDAQYFGLAQRRRRIFVIASARKGFDPAAVLFEWEGMRRDTPPSRTPGQSAAASLAASAGHHGYSSARGDGSDNLIAGTITGSGGPDENDAANGRLIPSVAHCLNAGAMGRIDSESETMIPVFFDSKSSDPARSVGEVAPTLRAMNHSKSHANGGGQLAVAHAFDARQTDVIQYGDKTGPLDTDGHTIGLLASSAVRRLTPVECERLQGFPDGYTLIPLPIKARKRRKQESEAAYATYLARRDVRYAADGPRYKALGNSMAVTVMAWIGRRIATHLHQVMA
jgi:DNA (cytosine-5)-methyltransferase 1